MVAMQKERDGSVVLRDNQTYTAPIEIRGNLMFPFLVPNTVHKKLAWNAC